MKTNLALSAEAESPRKVSPSPARRRRFRVGRLVVSALTLYLVAVAVNGQWQVNRLNAEASQLSVRIARMQRANAALSAEERQLGQKGYVAHLAQSRMGFVSGNQTQFILTTSP